MVEGLGLGHWHNDTNNKSSKKKKSGICFPQLLSGSLYYVGYLVTYDVMYWERHNIIYYSSQILKLLFNQEKQSDNSKLRDILQKNYSALFQNVSVIILWKCTEVCKVEVSLCL